MLGVNSYPQDYIDACRARVKTQVKSYRNLVKQAKGASIKTLDSALASFEPEFFNNMVLTLDSYFVHRLRGQEGKDGNPLNEVRVVCTSILQNRGVMSVDKTIRMNPAKSVLKYEVGDEIRVSEADFARISEAFFADIESKFT
jgi:hypothetical protein